VLTTWIVVEIYYFPYLPRPELVNLCGNAHTFLLIGFFIKLLNIFSLCEIVWGSGGNFVGMP